MSPRRKSKSAEVVPPPLHELEAEVMEQAWRAGETSVRAVMEECNRRAAKPRAYTTYMMIMARLHKQGLLQRRREGKTDFYAPVFERDDYLSRRSRHQVQQLVSEYGDVALSHFAEQMASLDPARRR